MTSTRTAVAERRVPMHLVVLVGCSAGAYSLALAGMTALQSRADAALARDGRRWSRRSTRSLQITTS